MAEVQWHSIEPAPVVLIAGKEALLAQRALERIVRLSRERHADLEIHRFTSTEITKSDVLQYTAPSLFGEPRLVIIDEVTRGAEPLINALMKYVQSPEQDVTLVLINRGDQRAKKLLDAVKKSGAPWVNAAEIKTAKAKMTFARSEFSRARRRVNSDAVKALVDAFGADLMEL
ncbi:MAG: DNA polymerase III subunit delta, partial [Dermabacter sp.]|nr:DNA polymerase III subunit delta [Dermabacter sp.]